MNIGIDIDGFLTDIATFQLIEGKRYFRNIVNPNGYSIRDIYNCSKKDEIKFWTKNIKYYFENARPLAKEFINYLHDNDNKIYIITSRAFTSDNTMLGAFMRHNVKRWLNKNNIYFDEILFCGEDKLDVIKKYNISIMGEDKPKNVIDISNHIPVICMSAPYNNDIKKANVYKISSFDEAFDTYNTIKNTHSKKKIA